MTRLGVPGTILALLVLAPPPVSAAKKQPPPLTAEHVHPSGSFGFRTPSDWSVAPLPGGRPGALEASGPRALVRFFYQPGEVGYDALHAECMLQRLGPMANEATIAFEYDFLSGEIGDLRILESAFRLGYDEPIRGERDWRQRNVTVVGAGHSLCVVAYVPSRLYRKDKELRALVDAVVTSVRFAPREAPPEPTP